METSAVISPCGRYRYELRRVWDRGQPSVLFVCLNPSTADADADDNTSRVCLNYARRWGFGGLLIGNLFALRSTDPSALYSAVDPVGSENDRWLRRLNREASLVVCAWGDAGGYMDRDTQVLRFVKRRHCLVRLKSGRPGHPLYKSKHLKPVSL